MNYRDALAALDARTNYERAGRLVAPTRARMDALMDLMNHPQRSFNAVHVTGTNGKTTVARVATEVLRAAGLHVATYISPHVNDVRERFLYDGEPISEHDFVEAWREVAPFLDHIDATAGEVTWFEAATALAFTWFADKGAEVAVIEVGMGGEWDATNVIDAPVAVMTPVDVDHPELGATPVEIAREKAGIVKRDAILYTAQQRDDVAEVLRARCAEMNAEIRAEGMAFELEDSVLAVGGQQVSFRVDRDRYPGLFLPMFGEHFARDAVLGVAAARAMLGSATLDEELVQIAFENLRVPGRMEVVHRKPLVVLDGAHNPAAAEALARGLTESFTFEKLTLVVGVMRDKDARGVLEPLTSIADEVIVTKNTSPRAMEPEDLADVARALGFEPQIVRNVADAIAVAIERNGDQDCIVVTGSLYTVGEARTALTP
jgi:dihydrofolate synthase/folylpolyglutamate synthase